MKKLDVLNLIKYHFENYEKEFKNQAINIAENFKNDGDEELFKHIMNLIAIYESYNKKDEKRIFKSGAVRGDSKGKGRCDLLPMDTIYNVIQDEVFLKIEQYKKSGDYRYLVELLKNELDLNPYTDILDISHRFEIGAFKYGEFNWQKGMPTSVYIDSAIRHYLKYRRGDMDEKHRPAYLWNIICCIWTCENYPDLNDYVYDSDEDEENEEDM